jgi:vancomycin resistance protein VanW
MVRTAVEGASSPTAVPPRPRSRVRLALGRKYHILRRHIQRWTGGYRWANPQAALLPIVLTEHATPLHRRLAGVSDEAERGKVANLRLAVAKLDGALIHPGETFSYWHLIGAVNARKGYQPGMVLSFGEVVMGIGGGLCQLSNLIYWMTIHTSLTVVERHRHGYDVFPDAGRSQPFGSGATCFYNYGDLMIRNDTTQLFQLHVWVTDERLCGQWLADVPAQAQFEIYEKEHIIRQEMWGGYSRHNLLFRRVFALDGTHIGDEFVVKNHALMMYSPLLPPAGS